MQQRLFLERIIFCNLRKQSSIMTTPCPQDFIQKFHLNKELRMIYFSYKLRDRFVLKKMFKEVSISSEIPVIEVQKSWFAEPETSPNGSPAVRVALQEPKTVTQL